MKKIFLLIAFLLFTEFLYTQWQPDMRLTYDPAASTTSINNGKCIASSGDTIHIVWFDERDGNEEIYYKRSTDKGLNWGQDIRLTNSTGSSNYPVISAVGSSIRVVWRDLRDGNYEEYYKRSTDGGTTWSTDLRLTNAQFTSSIPAIIVSGLNEHIVWHDYRDDVNNLISEIYYKHSTDGGITWGPDTRLTNAILSSVNPTITISNSIIHIAWADSRGGTPEIFYKRSTDNGNNWSTDIQLSNNPTSLVSNNPSISSSGSFINVVWNDNRDFNYEIYYKRSTDGGISWSADTRLTNASGDSYNASLVSIGSLVHFVWYDNRDVNYKIYYKRSIDYGVSWQPDLQLTTNNAGSSSRPAMSFSGTQIDVVWCDFRDGNGEIYYKNNPTGNIVSVTNTNTEIPKWFSLFQNYPNPFNPQTKIKFDVPVNVKGQTSNVKLVIYDMIGREVTTLVNEELKPGTYEADWDASSFSSGVYFYKIIAGDYIETKKMVLMK